MKTLKVMNMIKSVAKLLGVGLVFVALTTNAAMSNKQKADIEKRIKPVGSVCVQGDSSCGALASAAGAGAAAKKSPEEIYKSHCIACHGTGAAGAPKFGDKAAWKPHIAKGIKTLHQHAIHGFKGMPPKGLCMDCTDDEIKATVDYIVAHGK